MSTAQVRKIAQTVLAKHGLSNKVSARSTSFDCSRFQSNYIALKISDWTPAPIATEIEKEIKAQGDEQQIGILVEFSGPGVISAR